MKKSLLIWMLFFLSMHSYAQTIYHYRLIAKIEDGIRTTCSGSSIKKHITINGSTLYITTEFGEPFDANSHKEYYREWVNGFLSDLERVRNGSHYVYHYKSKENGILIYHHHIEQHTEYMHDDVYGHHHAGQICTRDCDGDAYIYLSDDYKTMNIPPFKSRLSEKKIAMPYEIYEIYDTDEKGNLPSKQESDPAHPSTIYR